MTRQLLAVVGIVGVVGLIGGTWWAWAAESPSDLPATESISSPQGSNSVALSSIDTPAPTVRSAAPPSVTVVDTSSMPVQGARATWIGLSSELLRSTAQWPALDWDAIGAVSSAALSDATGVCTFSAVPRIQDARVGLLFVEKSGYRTHAMGLSELDGHLPSHVQLEVADPLDVVVLDVEGRGVSDAQVELWLDCQRDDLLSPCDEARALRRCCRSTARTDASGRVDLPRPPAAFRIQASKDGLVSDVWAGAVAKVVKLRLLPTFTLTARVSSWPSAPPASLASIRWLVEEDAGNRLVRRVPVDSNGTVSPVQLPRVEGHSYFFQLECGDLALQQVKTSVPEPESNVDLEFNAEMGIDVDVLVLDELGRGLPDAVVTSNWNIHSEWTKAERSTDADGIARIRGVPAGQLWLRARRSNYVPRLLEPFEVLQATTEPVRIQLQKAGRLSGRCVHAGKPVRDFAVRIWTMNPSDYGLHSFSDREDGSFEIDEAPLGELTVLGMSTEFPSPRETYVLVTEGETKALTIEFPDALVGRGKVVDAITQEPLAHASVQLWSSLPLMRLRPWRGSFAVDARGEFRIEGFGPATTWTRVSAEGYADRYVAVQGAPAGELDVGLIGLHATQALVVHLSATEGIDPTAYTCDLQGSQYFDAEHFPKDGRMRFEGLAPGQYELWVNAPDRMAFFEQVVLAPGRDLVVDMPVRGRHLTVHVKTPAEEPLPKASTLAVLFIRSNGFDHEQQYELKPGVPVDVRCITTDSVVLEVREPSGLARAVRRVEFDARGPAEVEILVSAARRTLRVLDERRQPLATGSVFLSAEGGGNWTQTLVLDDAGECTVRDVGLARLYAAAYDDHRGLQCSAPIDFDGAPDGVVEMRFVPDRTLAVLVRERDRVCPGLDLDTVDVRGIAWGLGPRTTDGDGVARWPKVSRGEYVVRVAHPGWWPTEQLVRVGDAESVIEVQARRLGSARITVKNVLGNAIAGARVAFTSREQATDVRTWVDAGRVRASSNELVSDGSGVLRIDGLPNGAYAWTVTSDTGEVTGELVVPPQGIGDVEARVP